MELFLVVGSLAFLLIAVRKNFLRSLKVQPGLAANRCTVLILCFRELPGLFGRLCGTRYFTWQSEVSGLPGYLGFGIACTWLALLACNRWGWSSCWIERLSRCFGVTWIILALWVFWCRGPFEGYLTGDPPLDFHAGDPFPFSP